MKTRLIALALALLAPVALAADTPPSAPAPDYAAIAAKYRAEAVAANDSLVQNQVTIEALQAQVAQLQEKIKDFQTRLDDLKAKLAKAQKAP